MEPSNCIARLTSRDVKDARAWADQIAAESRESSRWAPYLGGFRSAPPPQKFSGAQPRHFPSRRQCPVGKRGGF